MFQSENKIHRNKKIRSLGICLGASTISIVQLELDTREGSAHETEMKPRIVEYSLQAHEGNPKNILMSSLNGLNPGSFDRIVATGRKFRDFINLTSIPEPEAVELAYRHVKPENVSCPAIVSAGGETFMIYVLNHNGRISNVVTGNKCASGTGEFYLQQLRRMDVSLEDASQWADTKDPYVVSGRCSVFCKSDCTHATNKGTPKSKVTAGLCRMMASKILELLKKIKLQDIMIIGGTARNTLMIDYLSREIPGLIVPGQAPYFEALGAALWGLKNKSAEFPGFSDLFIKKATPFDTLPPLKDFENMVEFKSMEYNEVRPGDECILGIDVGSTTTKAILLHKDNRAMLASVYLRTNGDPVGASRQCYSSILNQIEKNIDPSQISISGLGVCGSGRQITGLHALTDGIINEIIAHATAAVYFDPKVDTLFEIGGQDAKYTYITNSVPSDYAMNEACSAGTGSFLEEAAFETLGIKTENIAPVALKGKRPPNFNDQCAAFIASDIKNAIHEGIDHEDIVAGLVYSICMNYANRVKGNRPVGEKVFMQGGVCYNSSVPLAMAALTGKPIIVPPEPGLMGAFGVALEVKKRIEMGLMKEKEFDLKILAEREVKYNKPFICRGGKQKCDRRCEIAIIELENKKYPFGGACNRYYNIRNKVKYDAGNLDLVHARQELVFKNHHTEPANISVSKHCDRIGINRSFVVNTYYPLYAVFFKELGLETVLPDTPSPEGINQKNAAFCFPAELAHGFFHSLLSMKNPPEYLFMPHFKSIPAQNGNSSSQVCPFVQGETFFLQATFREKLDALKANGTKVLSPLINLKHGLTQAKQPLLETAVRIGKDRKASEKAFEMAISAQEKCFDDMKNKGEQVLAELESHPDEVGIVIFGRPYNGFVDEAHMGIPRKFASRGVRVIPLDFIPHGDNKAKRHMYWGMGQLILKTARFVKNHPQLFGTYITNFSCGPDSFIIGYFRDIMGQKPSLTLELDSHTADAGIETRIEAFLDIVYAYRQLTAQKMIVPENKTFTSAKTVVNNHSQYVITSSGKKLSLTDPRVTLLLPSMGRISTNCLAAAFKGKNFNVVPYPPASEAELKTGRANTSCKECLPLILTTGTLLNYIRHKRRPDEIVIYFMAGGSGPCRFGQYSIFMEDLVKRLEIPDVSLLSLSSENAYAGLGHDFERRCWWALVVSDVMEDIRSMLLTNAKDTESATAVFETELDSIIGILETGKFSQVERQLIKTAMRFKNIPLNRPPDSVPVISLVGEIFVRRDSLSRRNITEYLAEKGYAVICSPIIEWMNYADYLVNKGLSEYDVTILEKVKLFLKIKFKHRYEKRIKAALSSSGLVHAGPINIKSIIKTAAPFISSNLTGEAVLTVGSSLSEIASYACGVIAIGPFGCMPNRLSEAILMEIMNKKDKTASDPKNKSLQAILTNFEDLPFLAIESDGSAFPQLINAKLEAFCLRAKRLHERMYTYN